MCPLSSDNVTVDSDVDDDSGITDCDVDASDVACSGKTPDVSVDVEAGSDSALVSLLCRLAVTVGVCSSSVGVCVRFLWPGAASTGEDGREESGTSVGSDGRDTALLALS